MHYIYIFAEKTTARFQRHNPEKKNMKVSDRGKRDLAGSSRGWNMAKLLESFGKPLLTFYGQSVERNARPLDWLLCHYSVPTEQRYGNQSTALLQFGGKALLVRSML